MLHSSVRPNGKPRRGRFGAPRLDAAFDAAYYLRQYPDVAGAGVDPLTHFLSVGWAEGRNPCALFDTELYLESNPDVARAGLNPLIHYVSVGARENRQISLLFDAQWYLARNPDIAEAARANPLEHYLTIGAGEGREANPLFDQAWYLARYPDALQEAPCALAHYAERGLRDRLSPHPLFDGAFYLDRYPDVARAGMNPLAHFLLRGHLEIRHPHPEFHSEWYLQTYPDVARAHMNPLLHYVWEGAKAGRATRAVSDPALQRGGDLDAVTSDRRPPGRYAPTRSPAATVRYATVEESGPAELEYNIDGSSIDATGFGVVAGWMEGLADCRLEVKAAIPDAEFRWLVKTVPRADVRKHLEGLGKKSAPSGDGFVAAFHCSSAGQRLSLADKRNAVIWEIPLSFHAPQPRFEQIWTLSSFLGELSGSRVRDFRDLYGIAAPARNEEPGVAEVATFGPAANSAPLISVIVPFYRDWSYLLEHLAHQALPGGKAMEWIFVCDDPSIAAEMRTFMQRRQTTIAAPSKLVILDCNGGYGHANNLGVRHASGDNVLLLNSDVYMETLDPIAAAAAMLATDRTIGCVGFSLLFEDGTLQHDGIAFERLSDWDNLYVARHPRKGGPPQFDRLSPSQQCDAVTGAAMLLRRSDFLALNGFDPAYTLGDFEDTDLCLRLRQSGKRILLIRAPGLYHLERQSLRYVGDHNRRAGVTLANCMLFNARWRVALDAEANA